MKINLNEYRALVCPVCDRELEVEMIQVYTSLTAYAHQTGTISTSSDESGELIETKYTEVYCPQGHFRVAVDDIEVNAD